jgi:antitoxin (DNA-binding transcriptional repressor) of toxin-antitoxin stability system
MGPDCFGRWKMKKLNIRQARQALSSLERILELEGEVMITRRGDPIAKVVQVGRKRPIPSHRDLRNGMKRMHKGSETLLRELRDES